MIKVLIPNEADFRLYENQLKFLYEKNQDKICDTNSFEFVRDNTLFYLFLKISPSSKVKGQSIVTSSCGCGALSVFSP